ncbi:UvrD-helicase domain-containing protein [Leptolyngbya sp. AN03gr2]|uniref:UvrD-helicase domain-containing protein n=1 Tax=unclassified Leptolyngbya TaxID=2650499 RepID=UPI003D312F66
MQWIDFQKTAHQRLIYSQLDETQSQAKNFNLRGHSLVRGVAGSGKSLVLQQRIKRLVDEKFDRILVLSYNRFMHGWIEANLNQNDLQVECSTFHRWAFQRLKYSYEFDQEKELRQKLIESAHQSDLNYQAILIDEAQDFYDEWFQALLKVLDRETNSLFFVYDNTQSVYGQSHRRKSGWSWAKLGIDVVGRSQIFDLNYRNAPEILELAWKFIQPSLEQAEIKVEKRENSPSIDKLIEPKKKASRSSGVPPILVQVDSDQMAIEIANQVKAALESHSDSSIGILLHPKNPNQLKIQISKELFRLGISHHAPMRSQERDRRIVDRSSVLVDSWNAVKGIEFDAVIIVGVETSDEFEEKAGLYTAMTRAKDHLVLVYEERSESVEFIEDILTASDRLTNQE